MLCSNRKLVAVGRGILDLMKPRDHYREKRDIGAVKLRKLWQCRYQDNNCCKQHLGRCSTYWNIQATFDIITSQEVRTANLAWLL